MTSDLVRNLSFQKPISSNLLIYWWKLWFSAKLAAKAVIILITFHVVGLMSSYSFFISCTLGKNFLRIGLAISAILSIAYFGCWIILLWATWTSTALKLSCVGTVLTPMQCKRSRSSHPRQQPLAKQWTRDHAQTDWYNIRKSNIKSGETEYSPNMTAAAKACASSNGKYPWSFSPLASILPTDFHSSCCYFGDSGGTLTSGPYAAQARNSVQKAANTSLDTPSASAPISSTKLYFTE